MSDNKQDVKQEVKDVNDKDQAPDTEDEVVDTPVELSPIEEEASAEGWVPKEEWVAQGNDPEEWRSAKEFKERGELYKSIHSTKRELAKVQKTNEALQRHYKMVFEKAHRQAVQELKKERREALREGEVEKVDQIETNIEQLEQEHASEKAKLEAEATAPDTQPVHPSFQAWLPANQWYNKDMELREFADFVGHQYSRNNPGVAPEDVLKHVTKRVRTQFPDKFGAKKAAPAPTGAPSKKGSGSKGPSASDAEIEELGGNVEIMNTLIRGKVVTREQYINDLKQINKRK